MHCVKVDSVPFEVVSYQCTVLTAWNNWQMFLSLRNTIMTLWDSLALNISRWSQCCRQSNPHMQTSEGTGCMGLAGIWLRLLCTSGDTDGLNLMRNVVTIFNFAAEGFSQCGLLVTMLLAITGNPVLLCCDTGWLPLLLAEYWSPITCEINQECHTFSLILFFRHLHIVRSRNSAVCIATGYGLDDRGGSEIESR
jgi:hypothetical protein